MKPRCISIAVAVILAASHVQAATAHAEQCAETAEHASDLRDHGKPVDALRLYERCADDQCPRVVREDCRKALAQLRETTPRIVLHVRGDRGAELVDAQVTIDDVVVSPDERALGTRLNPGTHVVRAVRPPFVAAEREVLLGVNDRTLVVTLTMGKPVLAPATPRTRNHMAAFVVGGLGLGALAVFGVLGSWTLVDYQNLSAQCGSSCLRTQVDGVQTRAHIADAFLGAGLVTLAIATILWFVAPFQRR